MFKLTVVKVFCRVFGVIAFKDGLIQRPAIARSSYLVRIKCFCIWLHSLHHRALKAGRSRGSALFIYMHIYVVIILSMYISSTPLFWLIPACCIFFDSNKEIFKLTIKESHDGEPHVTHFLPTFICCRLAYNNSWCELFWIGWPVTDSICSSSVSQGWKETPCLTIMPNLQCSPWLQRTVAPRDPWCN